MFYQLCGTIKLVMNSELIASILLFAPTVFAITSIASWYQPGLRPSFIKAAGIASSLISIIAAAISGFFIAQNGHTEFAAFGLGIRLDSLSIVMFSMIALIGFVVVRFSSNYLDGDARQGRFLGRMAATIASVQLLVLSGTLSLLLISWILASMSLHRLLVFYTDRIVAQIAARKKFIVARIGDICLLGASLLLYFEFGTGNLEMIFQAIDDNLLNGMVSTRFEMAALLIALAALLKSAQFPTHGWLIEVMETPTPVSALLHAGLLNAGPFLLIRMAFILEASTYAPLVIIVIGGFTALFASVVFLTQTSIKTALGYSSVAHMGFSLMLCGLGLYPAALLHLVAHSFYKAHSFLSSGSVIDLKRASKVEKTKRTGNPYRILLGIVLAMLVYLAFAFLWGVNLTDELALVAIGGIIVMGLSTLFTSAIDSNGSMALVFRASLLAMIVAAAFFTLESGTHHLLFAELPRATIPSLVTRILISLILLSFGAISFIQILAPTFNSNPKYRAIAVHLRNGLYANALFDRWVGALKYGISQKGQVETD